MAHDLGLRFDHVSLRATEHGPAVYVWYRVTNHLQAASQDDDPIGTMRAALEAAGHAVNGIIGDRETVRAALEGRVPEVYEQVLARVRETTDTNDGIRPRYWACGHEVYPLESMWSWEDY